MSEPTIYIDSIAKGRITPQALLHFEGTITFPVMREMFRVNSRLFHIAAENFCFGMGFLNGNLVMQRNEYLLTAEPSFVYQIKGNETVLASWTLERLTFLLGEIGYQGPSISKSISMLPCPAPCSLFNWARSRSLLPVTRFEIESDFLGRVHASLDLVQTKIDQMVNSNIFWDFTYEGKTAVSRKPKNETDLHPIIQALLSDQMFLSSIEVHSECRTGVGNLDFLFVGNVKRRGMVKICAEFKLAHSDNLIRGIEHQLPAYMANQQTDHGTYCIVDFRGRWFNKPQMKNEEMTVELAKASQRSHLAKNNAIKVHYFRVGKCEPASRQP